MVRRWGARHPAATLLLALGVVAVVLAGVAVAWPSADGVIHACAAKNGALRLVAAGQTCRKHDSAIAWNQAGPPGPQGVQGPKGDPGPQSLSVSFHERETTLVLGAHEDDTVTASCGPGETIVGGGLSNWNGGITTVASGPSWDGGSDPGSSHSGWVVDIRNEQGARSVHVTVAALCVTGTTTAG